MIMSLKQRKIKFEPKINLKHSIYVGSLPTLLKFKLSVMGLGILLSFYLPVKTMSEFLCKLCWNYKGAFTHQQKTFKQQMIFFW